MSQPLAILAPSSLAVALLRDDMEEALGFAAQEKGTATLAAYQSDFGSNTMWTSGNRGEGIGRP